MNVSMNEGMNKGLTLYTHRHMDTTVNVSMNE